MLAHTVLFLCKHCHIIVVTTFISLNCNPHSYVWYLYLRNACTQFVHMTTYPRYLVPVVSCTIKSFINCTCSYIRTYILLDIYLFTQQSSDATQFTCSMDTTDNNNAPLSPPKPFQFTASAEVHSLPTGTRETSTTITPIQGLTTKTSPKDNNDEFSTPENQIGVPLIQPLSQSPHVAGKTPHGTSAMIHLIHHYIMLVQLKKAAPFQKVLILIRSPHQILLLRALT